jgi:hypothetical protein
MSVEATLAQMAGEDSDETRGWDAGLGFAESIKREIATELATMRRLKFSEDYIEAWKASAGSIFYTLTDEAK